MSAVAVRQVMSRPVAADSALPLSLLSPALPSQHKAGTLPASWGSPAGAFAKLANLRLHNNSALSGAIPGAWGEPGAFPVMKACPAGAEDIVVRCSL